ncbi:MAG: poly-gamma-glutamate synthase PgsB [Candidatus Aminicenantes bacterium]|nr:poly-gamma-glutamate synthase PgsB [Candidatus Aminicenantes bacterium]
MREIAVTGGVFLFFLLYLYAERFWLSRHIENIPLRICVTGTRGKSSVTRLIASILRESGYRVLAKTTGSKAVVIDPDGCEEEIARSGVPSPLENKKLIKRAFDRTAQAVVLEMMSIRPESLQVESVRMLRPHILVITNVRLDHVADMGSTRDAIAAAFASAIPDRGTMVVLDEEFFPVFQSIAERRNARVTKVEKENFLQSKDDNSVRRFSLEFKDNIRLALAVSRHLGIDEASALRAAAQTVPDFGSLKIWVLGEDLPYRTWYFVSAFAANDPESTKAVISKLENRAILRGRRIIGLLNFRGDRGDRTLQWLEALQKNEFPEYHRLILLGDHTHAMKRRLSGVLAVKTEVWPELTAANLMKRISEEEKGDVVLVGMGNMGGAGKALVDYWDQTGKRHDL